MSNNCILCNNQMVQTELNGLEMLRCGECGLICRAQFDLPGGHYEEKSTNLSERKLEDRTSNAKKRIKLIASHVSLDNLCDIGCGEGIFLSELVDIGNKNVCGLDLSAEGVAFAQSKGLDVSMGNISDAPGLIKAKNIKTITLFHVIEHLPNPLETLKALRATFPNGGYLVIETPNIEAYSIIKSDYRHQLVYPEHLYYFNLYSLKLLLEKSGFKAIAFGKRDFDDGNLSIKECLLHLGIINKAKMATKSKKNENNSITYTGSNYNLIRKSIRVTLNAIVSILGRKDYIWIIGQTN